MGRIGMPELIVIAIVFLLLFGAKKLPDIARSVGKALREFKKAGKEIEEGMKDETPASRQGGPDSKA